MHKNELLLHVNINQFFTKVVSIPPQLHTKNCSGGKIDTFWAHTKLKNLTKKLLKIVNFKIIDAFFSCLFGNSQFVKMQSFVQQNCIPFLAHLERYARFTSKFNFDLLCN